MSLDRRAGVWAKRITVGGRGDRGLAVKKDVILRSSAPEKIVGTENKKGRKRGEITAQASRRESWLKKEGYRPCNTSSFRDEG